MQQFLKSECRAARAEIVAAEFFEKFFVRVDDADTVECAVAFFHAGFGRVAFPMFASCLETRRDSGVVWFS